MRNLPGLLIFMTASIAYSQTTVVPALPTQGDTTISVKQGAHSDRDYEITEGSGEIDGEPHVLMTEARKNWKKACEEWKKETKELNKENQLLSLSCNSSQCSTANGQTGCKSTGTYKVRVKIRN